MMTGISSFLGMSPSEGRNSSAILELFYSVVGTDSKNDGVMAKLHEMDRRVAAKVEAELPSGVSMHDIEELDATARQLRAGLNNLDAPQEYRLLDQLLRRSAGILKNFR